MKPPLPTPPNPLGALRVCQRCGKQADPTRLDDMALAMYGKCWVCVNQRKVAIGIGSVSQKKQW